MSSRGRSCVVADRIGIRPIWSEVTHKNESFLILHFVSGDLLPHETLFKYRSRSLLRKNSQFWFFCNQFSYYIFTEKPKPNWTCTYILYFTSLWYKKDGRRGQQDRIVKSKKEGRRRRKIHQVTQVLEGNMPDDILEQLT